MNLRSLALALIALPLVAPALRADTWAPASAPAGPPASADEKKTELEARMQTLGRGFRALGYLVPDPALKAAALEILTALDSTAKAAADLTPAKSADLPEDQRERFIASYRAQMKELEDLLGNLRASLTAGDTDQAVKVVAQISEVMKKGHHDFRKPKGELLNGVEIVDISKLDQMPVVRSQVRPRYPSDMRSAGISGEVLVEFLVDPQGDVRNAFVVHSSRPEFDASALESVSKWKFKPGMKDGRVVVTRMQVPLVFSLDR